jgi:hypothetical protein
LKRGSTRFWLSASAVLFVTASTEADQRNAPRVFHSLRRSSESKLAGILPGHTAITRAQLLLGKTSTFDLANQSATWQACDGHELIVDFDGKGTIQQIRAVADLSERRKSECNNVVARVSNWVTGKGLRLGNSTIRVLQLYGEPDSRSPSTKDGQRLELLYYAFDWAGPDVPQVMELLCTVEDDGKPGRVVEIMLAASSL